MSFILKLLFFIKTKKSSLTIVFFLSIFGIFILYPEIASADDTVTAIQENFAQLISIIVHFIVYISWLVIGLMGDLLTNDLVMHPNIEPILHLMWTVVRNFVNLIFVGILLFIAFKTIFNSGGDASSKVIEHLGKFAIALVVVNFSFLGVKVLIDVSTIATNAAFTLYTIVETGTNTDLLCTDDNEAKKKGNCMKQVYSLTMQTFDTKKGGRLQECTADQLKSKDYESGKCIKSMRNSGFVDMIYVKPVDAKGTAIDDPNKKAIANKLISEDKEAKDFNRACVVGNESRLCTLEEYLKYREKVASIIIQVQNFDKKSMGITNRSIVPIIAQSISPLQNFVIRDPETQTLGQLIIETLFSLLLSIIFVLAFVAMFIVLIVRVAILWIAFMLSPLIVFKIIDIDVGIKKAIDQYLTDVIHITFAPAMFGVVLSLAMIIVGKLMYTETSFDISNKTLYFQKGLLASSNSGIFNLLLMILVIVLLWMGVFAAMKTKFTGTWLIDPISNSGKKLFNTVSQLPFRMDIVPIPVTKDGKMGATSLEDILGINKKIDDWSKRFTGSATEDRKKFDYKDSKAEKVFMDINLNDDKYNNDSDIIALKNFNDGPKDFSNEKYVKQLDAAQKAVAKLNGNITLNQEDRKRAITDLHESASDEKIDSIVKMADAYEKIEGHLGLSSSSSSTTNVENKITVNEFNEDSMKLNNNHLSGADNKDNILNILNDNKKIDKDNAKKKLPKLFEKFNEDNSDKYKVKDWKNFEKWLEDNKNNIDNFTK